MAQDYIEKIFDVEAYGKCGFRAIAHAMECGQDAYMEIRKELYNNIQAQYKFYLNQGFFHNLEHTAA